MRVIKLFFALLFSLAAIIPGSALAQSAPHEIRLNASEIKKLNTFLSNFSEVFMEPFSKDTLTDKAMIAFAVAHNYRNREKLFEKLKGSAKARLKENHVSETTQKYFGRKIAKHQSAGDYEYKGGYYYLHEASGETLQFSQATRLLEIGNNSYAVDVNVYFASSGWVGSIHETPASWKKSGEETPELSHKIKAIIAKNTGKDGKSSYILIEYLKQ